MRKDTNNPVTFAEKGVKGHKMKWNFLLALLIGLILITTVHAQSDESPQKKTLEVLKIPDIVVTDRLVKGFEEKLHEQPATIHSITSEEMEKMDIKRTLDLIRKIPGVTAEDYNQQGVAAAYSFRGFRAGHGIGAASYLDGIPYNEINHVDGDGYPDYNTILPESIERLEVIKGLSSPLFGGYAQAGVLHYITKDRGNFNKLKLSTGSWDYRRGVAEIAREYDRFFTYNAVSFEQGDGYRDHSEFDSGNIFSRFGYKLDEDSSVRLTLHSYKTTWDAPGPITQADWDAGNLEKQVTDGGGDKKKNMVSVDYRRNLNNFSEISLLGYVYDSNFTRWTGANNEERHDERNTFGSRAMYNISSDFAGFKNDLVLGADYEHIDSEQHKWNMQSLTNRVRALETVSGDFDFQNTALYFQEDFWPFSFMKLTIGGRYEMFDGDLKNNLTGKEYSFSDEIFNPKGGILVRPMEGLDLFGNIGTGFVLPKGYKKYENSQLDPSELTSYEIGVRFLPVAEMLLQLAIFRTDTKDEVITDPITLVETNAGETRRQGIEAGAEWNMISDLSVYVNGVYQDAEYVNYNTSSGDLSGKDIQRVPEWIARAGLEYFPKLGLGGSLTAKYTGERWSDSANTNREDDFWIFDASVRYAMEKVTFTLFLNNIFDKKYAELQGINSYYPSDPFNVTLSCSLTF
ncbi:MAG: TonB-dependent receptor [Desulfobacterales bacterium]|uniref:TonB-dependent receptor n=1 Tax=Candidatus Desulfatibia vada TaxID=2841696 RepID=A0A8J6NTT0_9BACT|nr:TonB-dependent receptor [Candidatus Desulfatibia vada]MBL6970768.1 TonB-dependent receptor [Desulfobacterales bacterium]